MAEPDQMHSAVDGVGEARRGLGGGNQLAVVVPFRMGNAGPTHEAAGKEASRIIVYRPLDAVGGHQDRAGEVRELLALEHPGAAEMTDQMLVLLEFGIAVGGEHLAVGVDVDPCAFGLLQQRLEIGEIVTGNQDRLAGNMAELNRGRHWMAV